MDNQERDRILAEARARRAAQDVSPAPAAAPQATQQPYVRASGEAQIRVIDENNPPSPRGAAAGRMGSTVPVGRVMGARVLDPNDMKPGPRVRGQRVPGQYGANVVVGGGAPPQQTVGQALRTPIQAGGMPHGAQPQARAPMPQPQPRPQQAARPAAHAPGLPQQPPPPPNPALAAQLDALLRQQQQQQGPAGFIPPGAAGPHVAAPMAAPPAQIVSVADVMVIMSQHRRPGTLERQYRALRASGIEEHQMCCWVNQAGIRLEDNLLVKIQNVKAKTDMGPFMRWTLIGGLPPVVKYVLVIDDDCTPGPMWIPNAVARLEQAEREGHNIAIAAAGLVYQSDQADNVLRIGTESVHRTERDVDLGRGAWLMRVDHARAVIDYPKLGCWLSTSVHVAAALQRIGVSTIVLPYLHEQRDGWGMLSEPTTAGSLSEAFDREAAQGRGPGAAMLKAADYDVYRHVGWEPLCVMEANASYEPPRYEVADPAPAAAPAPAAPAPAEAPATA